MTLYRNIQKILPFPILEHYELHLIFENHSYHYIFNDLWLLSQLVKEGSSLQGVVTHEFIVASNLISEQLVFIVINSLLNIICIRLGTDSVSAEIISLP